MPWNQLLVPMPSTLGSAWLDQHSTSTVSFTNRDQHQEHWPRWQPQGSRLAPGYRCRGVSEIPPLLGPSNSTRVTVWQRDPSRRAVTVTQHSRAQAHASLQGDTHSTLFPCGDNTGLARLRFPLHCPGFITRRLKLLPTEMTNNKKFERNLCGGWRI